MDYLLLDPDTGGRIWYMGQVADNECLIKTRRSGSKCRHSFQKFQSSREDCMLTRTRVAPRRPLAVVRAGFA